MVLLTLGFALATGGLLAWHAQRFDLATLTPFGAGGEVPFNLHPVYLIVLGIAIIPPTLWDIFTLELKRGAGPDRHEQAAKTPTRTADSYGRT